MRNYLYTARKKTKIYTVAENYNELTAKQLIAICDLLHKKLSKDDFLFRCLRHLLNMNNLQYALLSLQVKHVIISDLQWLLEKNRLTQQLIYFYDGFYGPASDFDNLTMKEWNSAEQYYFSYLQDYEDATDALNSLVACLYRVGKDNYDYRLNPDGDIRKPYNSNLDEYYAKNFIAYWPLAVKHAIVMWYDGCREAMVELYPIFDKPKGEVLRDPGMFDVIRGLSGDKYGSFAEVENLNVHIAMRELYELKKEYEEFKRKTDISNER